RELTIVASTAVTDVFSRHPVQTATSRFRTVDLSPPHVVTVDPADGAIQVASGSAVTVTFDEALGDATDFASLVELAGPAGTVAGASSRTAAKTATFTPDAPLPENAVYTVTVNGAIDRSGNKQTQAFTSVFKTRDTVPPALVVVSPAPGTFVK